VTLYDFPSVMYCMIEQRKYNSNTAYNPEDIGHEPNYQPHNTFRDIEASEQDAIDARRAIVIDTRQDLGDSSNIETDLED
jgi:hypothetical protein